MNTGLTIAGIDVKIMGFFRPNIFAMKPQKMLPIKPPTDKSDAIHEASSIVILPDDNGESSDISKMMLGIIQPPIIP